MLLLYVAIVVGGGVGIAVVGVAAGCFGVAAAGVADIAEAVGDTAVCCCFCCTCVAH